MTRKFAQGTTVVASQTIGEIHGLLAKHGAGKVATLDHGNRFELAFDVDGVIYRMAVPMPDPSEQRFTHYMRGGSRLARTESAAQAQYEAEINRKWRAFGAVIKANLIAVDEGITTLQDAFVGSAVVSNGRTVAEQLVPKLREIASGELSLTKALPGRGE